MSNSSEFDVTLVASANGDMSDETLEAHADELLEAVLTHAADVALGAGVAVNFATRSLELDFTVVADSLADAHDRVAEVQRRIAEQVDFKMRETRSETALVTAAC
jgi:hypothetical protein